ncbi:MAG: HAMP domain-containing histidine kinase [Planctomycetes bacterium]|nr:HAMP domain-containing histidine kinase [Planctomycetota bacterium]
MAQQAWFKKVFLYFRYGLIERIKFSDKGRRIKLTNTRAKTRPGLTDFEQRFWFWPVVCIISFSLFSTGIMLLAPDLGRRSVWAGLIAGTLAVVICILIRTLRRQRFLTMRTEHRLDRANWELDRFIIVLLRGLRLPLKNIKDSTKHIGKQCKTLQHHLKEIDITDDAKELIGKGDNSAILANAKNAWKNAGDIDTIVQGLLTLGRLRKRNLQKSWIDMNSLVVGIVEGFRKEVNVTGTNVQMRDLPSCLADRVMIQQLFEALIKNSLAAISASRDGTIKMWGWVEGSRAVYCVEDNGIGIAAENRDKIFEMFYTVDPHRPKGTGLGLNVVRRVTRRHNGRLWVKSTLGKGTTVTISLPIR